eukprot:6761286-Lingulodinium_polyedra.AAC.1
MFSFSRLGDWGCQRCPPAPRAARVAGSSRVSCQISGTSRQLATVGTRAASRSGVTSCAWMARGTRRTLRARLRMDM